MTDTGIARGDVYLMRLNPTRGAEIRSLRPCLVLSPNRMNELEGTIIVAPMTTGLHPHHNRVPCEFLDRPGYVLISQIRAVDRSRIVRLMGKIDAPTLELTLNALRNMFSD